MNTPCRLAENRSVYALLARALARDPAVASHSLFLNWGYDPVSDCPGPDLLSGGVNASHVRLVHELLSDTPLEERNILDVGCGRGGLLSVLTPRCSPRRLAGVDLCPENIDFCRSVEALRGVRFLVADACHLPQPDESVDVLLNLESAGAYPDLVSFLMHVARVLRPDGVFLYGDVLPASSVPDMVAALGNLGLELIDDRDITPNVLEARRRSGEVESRIFADVLQTSDVLSNFLESYRASPGSPLFCAMEEGRIVYRLMRYRKTRCIKAEVPIEIQNALSLRSRRFHDLTTDQKHVAGNFSPVRISEGKSTPWLPWGISTKVNADVRLFCLPWSGGSASAYRGWERFLPAGVEVCPVELPGRGTRFPDPAIDDIAVLIPDMAEGLRPFLDRPFAVFGHSLGALLAFELTLFLSRTYGLLPDYVFVSGRRPPQQPSLPPFRYSMSDVDLQQNLASLGGMPEEVMNSPELLHMLLPVLRSDFKLTERYGYDGHSVMTCPVTAFVGTRDPEVSVPVMRDWKNVSGEMFSFQSLDGDHFYLLAPDQRRRLLAHIGTALIHKKIMPERAAAE